MKYRKRLLTTAILPVALAAFTALFALYAEYGFAREVEARERKLREQIVATAARWIGTQEGDAGHERIVQTYNAHEPLAQGYEVTTSDNWCAAFASVAAIETGLTGIIPTECGCQRQIDLWKELGRWEEDDNYLPLPGDYIYYAWDEGWDFGDCTGWADHVGIVAGTAGPFIRVIEGNYADQVISRTILRGDMQIRGYGLPDYAATAKETE
jgi:hypothetical protein